MVITPSSLVELDQVNNIARSSEIFKWSGRKIMTNSVHMTSPPYLTLHGGKDMLQQMDVSLITTMD